MSDYCDRCFGSGWADGGCVNPCESCDGSGRGPDVEALNVEINRLRIIEGVWKLQKHMPAAVTECLEAIEKLEAENESLRKDAELGRIAMEYFDRMDDPADCDPLEKSVSEFLAAIFRSISSPENPS